MAKPSADPQAGIEAFMGASFWEKHRNRLIGVIVLGAIILAIALFMQNYGQSRESEGWSALMDPEQPGTLLVHVDTEGPVSGSTAEPWALFINARSAYVEDDVDEAEAFLAQLQEEFPQHPLVSSDEFLSLRDDVRNEMAWRANNSLPSELPQVDDNKVLTIKTELGNLRIGLFLEEAPVACQEFLKLVREGGLAQGSISEVMFRDRSVIISPPKAATVPLMPTEDDDEGDEDAVKEEATDLARGLVPDRNFLGHFAGAVSFAYSPQGQLEADASPRIAIYLEDNPEKDDQEVVFGVLLSGMEQLQQVSTRPTIDGENLLQEPLMVAGIEEGSGLSDI